MPSILGRQHCKCMPKFVSMEIVSNYMYRDIGQYLMNDLSGDKYFISNLY
jgi:hypothetical protein